MSAETTTLLKRIERLAASASDAELSEALRRIKRAAKKPGRDVRNADLQKALSHSACVPAVIALAQTAGWKKQIAMICGKAGVAGAIVDGGAGGLRAANLYRQGAITGDVAVKHVGAEAGCGFVTSSTGTAGTLAVFMLTGSMGPMALAAGMGASMGSRYLYKQAVGDVLPDEEELDERIRQSSQASDQTDAPPQDIGPDTDAGPSVEDIGPSDPPQNQGPRAANDDGPAAAEDVDSIDDQDEAVDGQEDDSDPDSPFEGIGPSGQ